MVHLIGIFTEKNFEFSIVSFQLFYVFHAVLCDCLNILPGAGQGVEHLVA